MLYCKLPLFQLKQISSTNTSLKDGKCFAILFKVVYVGSLSQKAFITNVEFEFIPEQLTDFDSRRFISENIDSRKFISENNAI